MYRQLSRHFRRYGWVLVFLFIMWWILLIKTSSNGDAVGVNKVGRVNDMMDNYSQTDGLGEDSCSLDFELSRFEERECFRRIHKEEHFKEDRCHFTGRVKSDAEIQIIDLYASDNLTKINTGVWQDGATTISYKDESFEQKQLEIVLMPHSHNDPGWLNTYEGYFKQSTNKIINNVIHFLEQNPGRRFSWAEISYFSLWWYAASSDMHSRVKALIDNGQLEFVTGGWVMEDEANTYLYAIVDQVIEGNHFIKEKLNAEVKSGWSVDPFGQSSTQAYIRKRMGIENIIIQRTHYRVKRYMSSNQMIEFKWRQNWADDDSLDVFTNMLSTYQALDTCGPERSVCCEYEFARLATRATWGCPGHPPKAITEQNVAERSATLVDQYKKKAQLYKSNVVIGAIGADFSYASEAECSAVFNNYERIFEYVNSHPELNTHIQWGTLTDYFTLARKRLSDQQHIPTFSGDFFTYADNENIYWSGYFTSRPFYKGMDRVLESRLRAAEIVFSMANFAVDPQSDIGHLWTSLAPHLYTKLTEARRNLGVFQHHDAITGTARDHVVVDYGQRLLVSIGNADHTIEKSSEVLMLLADNNNSPNVHHKLTHLSSFKMTQSRASHDSLPVHSVIPVTSMQAATSQSVVFYNPLAFRRHQTVFVLVDCPDSQVVCGNGKVTPSQVSLHWSSQVDELSFIPSVYELWFTISLDALSISRCFVGPADKGESKTTNSKVYSMNAPSIEAQTSQSVLEVKSLESKPFKLFNYHYVVHFGSNGLIEAIEDRNTKEVSLISLDLVIYEVTKGGAYIFVPGGNAKPAHFSEPSLVIEKGHVFSRVTVLHRNIVHTVQLFNSQGIESHSVSISNLVDVRMLSNRELAMRIDGRDLMRTEAGNLKRMIYTDLNGFQMQARHFQEKMPLQASFYPMPSQMILNAVDGKSRVTLHSTQASGAGITSEGFIDVMLDRKLMQDDGKGLGQGVKDNKVTPYHFWLTLETFPDSSGHGQPPDASDYMIYPTVLGQHSNVAVQNPIVSMLEQRGLPQLDTKPLAHSGWKSGVVLPCDVHLLSLRTMNHEQNAALIILQRLAHSCTVGSSGYHTPTEWCKLTDGHFNLPSSFPLSDKGTLNFKEMTLNGIHRLSEASQTYVHMKPHNLNTYWVTK